MLDLRSDNLKFPMNVFSKHVGSPLMRYLAVGFTTFAIEYALFCILVDVARLNYLLANAMVFSVVFWFNFLANRIWTFQSTVNLRRQLLQYAANFLFILAVPNGILMILLTHGLGMNPKLSKVLVMAAVVSWNYIIYKKVVYK